MAEVNARRRQAAPGRQLTGSSWNDPEVQNDPSLALDYIVAPPRMAHYIDWSTKIYGVYLKYLAPEFRRPAHAASKETPPLNGSFGMLFGGCLIFILSYMGIAIFVVSLTADLRLALSLGGGYSVLAFTFSGLSFPIMAMFGSMRAFSRIFPFTYFTDMIVDQALRGEFRVRLLFVGCVNFSGDRLAVRVDRGILEFCHKFFVGAGLKNRTGF